MPLWRNIRRLAWAGAVQGVQNPGPVDIIVPAQGVSLLDDASRAVAPPRYPTILAEALGPGGGVLLENNGVEVQARAGGIWLTFIYDRSGAPNSGFIFRADDDFPTTFRAPIGRIQTWGVPFGEGPESGIFDVRVLETAIPASRVAWRGDGDAGGSYPFDIFIAPGERLFVLQSVDNGNAFWTLALREVPVRERA